MPKYVKSFLYLTICGAVCFVMFYGGLTSEHLVSNQFLPDETRLTQESSTQQSSSISDDMILHPFRSPLPDGLEICGQPRAKGRIPVNTKELTVSEFMEFESNYTFVEPGGRWRPRQCVARHRVAILIPVRDRKAHIRILLRHLHPFLRNQELDYGIFVVEQTQEEVFNKALMFNAGFLEITKRYGDYYQCFVLHDVDLLPEDDRIIYNCSSPPRHLGAYVDRVQYRAAYSFCSGGVMEVTASDFRRINGYSNLYFGWGAEDDDFSLRMFAAHFKFTRYPQEWAHYTSIRHGHSKSNPRGYRYFKLAKKRIDIDGLHTAKYQFVNYTENKLYTHILVAVDRLEIFRDFANRAMESNRTLEWLKGELGNDTFPLLGIDESKYVDINKTF